MNIKDKVVNLYNSTKPVTKTAIASLFLFVSGMIVGSHYTAKGMPKSVSQYKGDTTTIYRF